MVMVSFRISDEEKALAEKMARREGLSVSEWFRMMAFGKKVVTVVRVPPERSPENPEWDEPSMSKKKSVIFDTQRLVNHGELRALVEHLSAKFVAIETRLDECERMRPVDPAAKEAGDALIASVRAQTVEAERALMLVPDDPESSDAAAAEIGDALAAIPNEIDPETVPSHHRVELGGELMANAERARIEVVDK